MSSTGRGSIRSDYDFYCTDPNDITVFLKAIEANDKLFAKKIRTPGVLILDPCAGGNVEPVDWLFKEGKNGKPDDIIHIEPTEMSYPKALRAMYGPGPVIKTIDIREDSPADDHGNFLDLCYAHDDARPDIIISNPPFSLAVEFVQHSLKLVRPGGFVIFLQRLNFFGSQTRKPFWDKNMPMAHYIHHERMGFIPSRPSATDSIEYAHFVWHQGWNTGYSIGRLI